jgi:methionyl-tRNA formyltransferase
MEGIPALEGLLESGVAIEAILTLKPELAAKRSAAVGFQELSQRYGVPLHEIGNINEPTSLDLLRQLAPDLLLVIGWSQLLHAEALSIPRIGVVGAHASLLPRNRGSAPINWVLIHGEEQTGNSLIWLAEETDAGDIIDQTVIPITPYDTCATLYEQVGISNRDMILRLVAHLVDGHRPGRRQVETGDPILPRRRPQDGLVDWTSESGSVYNFIRALTAPYPGAFSHLDGRRWTIQKAALLPFDGVADATPGEVLGPVVSPVDEACGQVVACGHGTVLLLEVEGEDGQILAGRRLSEQPWTGKRWTNG